MSLHSSAPVPLHALRTRCPADTAPYLNQARATYPGGVSELDAALHLLHQPDEDLEVAKITVFVEGADEAPSPPPPDQPGVRRHQTNPPVHRRVRGVPQGARLVPRPPAGDARNPRLGQPAPIPPPLQDQGSRPQREGPLARAPGHPPAPPRRRDPGKPGPGPGDHPHPPVQGSPRNRPPLLAPAARDGVHTFLRTQEVTAVTGVHLVGLPSAPPNDPRGPSALSPAPDWELWRDVWAAWLTRPPAQCRWMAAVPRPHRDNATTGPPFPPPLPPAEHCTALPRAQHRYTGR